MTLPVLEFIDRRIEETAQNLCKTNSEFALAVEKSKALFENTNPILHQEGDTVLTTCDKLDFTEYFNHEFTITAIMQQELYKQGYLDCVKLLNILGVIR